MILINKLDEEFDKYYKSYLGIQNTSKNDFFIRDNKFIVNDFTYSMIVSRYKNEIIYSTVADFYRKEENLFLNADLTFCDKNLNLSVNEKEKEYCFQRMRRMSKISECDVDTSEVKNVCEDLKKYFFESFLYNQNDSYKQKKWEKLNKNKYINCIVKDGKIVSLGFVSNIDYGGANIVIHTLEAYRNKGYGKSIVEKISKEVLLDGIMPIYWVNEENVFSIMLAESLGFITLAEEIVLKQ